MDIFSWLPPTTKSGVPVNSQQIWIDALQMERRGYLIRGQHERVAMVDKSLAALGVMELASVEPDVETAVVNKGKKRKKQ